MRKQIRPNINTVYDWNTAKGKLNARKPRFNDETLRDGLQWPFARIPTAREKIEILRLMNILKIEYADLGLPMAGKLHYNHIAKMIRAIIEEKMKIKPSCAVRTVIRDIEAVDRLQQELGVSVRADMFLGISQPRLEVEGWNIQDLIKMTIDSVQWARDHNIPVMFVTEDTTRAHPDVIKVLYSLAIGLGAEQICVCDTVGHATPQGVDKLIKFVINEIVETSEKDVLIHWHGHRDRALDIINALVAFEAGADFIHGTALGIGERAGNVPMELLMVNLKLMGLINTDLTKLADYVRLVQKYTRVPLPTNYPVFGETAFATGTGVHASAIIKANEMGGTWWADTIYSGIPASMVGREQEILVGPMSGKSNVIYWLKKNRYEPTQKRVDMIFEAAKNSTHVLSERTLHSLASIDN